MTNGWRDRMEPKPNIDIVSKEEVFQNDKRNSKKMMLPTDAICAQCGLIFNSVYEDQCLLCEFPYGNKEDVDKKENKDSIDKPVIEILKDDDKGKDKEGHEVCDHTDFIMGRQSVDLRILLDFHLEDIRALCEIHGCSEGGSRGKMVVNIMKHLHSNLDKRIDEHLVRKMIIRNRKKFRFWRDIDSALSKAKRSKRIELVSADDCIEMTEFGVWKK